MQGFVCALQDWSLCFPQSYGSSIIKSLWPSRSDSLGIPSPVVRTPGWKPDVGFRIFTTVGQLIWYYCFPVCGSPIWQVWNLFLLWLCPSYHLAVACSLTLYLGYVFLVGSSVLLLMVVQHLAVILELSREQMSAHPSSLPSWTRSPLFPPLCLVGFHVLTGGHVQRPHTLLFRLEFFLWNGCSITTASGFAIQDGGRGCAVSLWQLFGH